MEKIKVVPLRVNLTKEKKSVFTYAIEDTDSSFSKGYVINTQWFDSPNLFNNLITKEHMGQTLEGQYEYEKTFNGNARLSLKTMANSNGVDLLS